MADIKNFGIKGLASDVQMGKSGGRLKYDSGNSRFDFVQSNGSTLEDVRFGSVTAGAWQGTAIGTQYGGTGQDFSSSTGILLVNSGTASAGNIDLSDADFINTNTQLALSSGGTGASTASGARTNLGLGTIATQASNNVDIDGGALDGTIIGGTTPAAITGTTIVANTGFTGNLTGTAQDADGLSSAVTVALTGDATGSATFEDAGDTASIAMTLANSGVTAGNYGGAGTVPVITVDAKGRVTAVSSATVSSAWTLSDGSNTSSIDSSDTLVVSGTANEVDVVVSGDTLTIGLPNDVTIGNDLTVTGTLNSDDITSSQVTVSGDAVISGNLTVNGTQTIVNSTTVSVDDATFRVNSDGASQSAGLEANIGGTIESILFVPGQSRWEISDDVFTSGTVTANDFVVNGNSISDFLDEDNFGSDSATALASQQSIKAYVDTTVGAVDLDFAGDTGGDLSIDLDSEKLTIAGGTGLSSVGSGNGVTVNLDNTAVTAGSYGSSTAIPTFTVDAQGRLTAAGTASISIGMSLAGDSGSSALSNGDTITIAGGTNLTSVVNADTATVSLDANISLENVTATGTVEGDTLTDGTASITAGAVTGVTTLTASGAVTGGSFTDGTATLSGGSLTGGVAATFSGAVTGGSFTDGTATMTGGAITGLTGAVTTAGAVTGASLTDGTATLASGSLTGAVNVTASGTVGFGSLNDGAITITGFADEDNMASDSATLIPTQQSVKAYVDGQLTAQDLDFAADGGSGSIDLDSESLTIAGGNVIGTTASGNTVTINLNDSGVTAASYGSTTAIPTFTVDSYGRLTAASTVAISTSTTIQGDSGGAQTVDNGDAITIAGGTGISTVSGATDTVTVSLDDTAVSAGTYGNATTVPTFTVDAQGRITSASATALSTAWTVSDGSSTSSIDSGDTLTINGTANEIDVAVSGDSVTLSIPDDVTLVNPTVSGTLTSDDITSSSVSVTGDAIITGNLTVQGTQTIVNSTTVEAADPIFRVNTAGTNTDAGFEANTASGVKSILYTATGTEWDFGSENVKASTFEGDLTGDVTGQVSDISNHSTTNLPEGTNEYHTPARARAAISVTDAGGDGGLAYNSSTGVITFTGVTASETRAHLSAGTGVTYTAGGQFSIGQSVGTGDDVTFNSVTGNVTGNLTGNSAGTHTGNVSGTTGTFSGAVSFGSLSDGTDTVTGFVTEADAISSNDNDATIPTSAAVRDYVDNFGGDGLMLRSALTSGVTTIDTAAMPNVSSRTYYASKIVIKIGTAFSGGSFNQILVKENGGSGTTLVAADDADAATAGTYIVELDGDISLTKNAAVQVQFKQADGSTDATTTAGVGTITVHYNYV
jgi:hypothetical protein